MPTTRVGEVDRQKAVEAVVRSAAGLDDTQLTEAFELMLGSRGKVGFSRDHVLTALRALLRADKAVDTATALALPLQEAVVNNRFYLRHDRGGKLGPSRGSRSQALQRHGGGSAAERA